MDSQEDSNGEFTNLCSNCSHHVNRLFDMDEGKLCATCYTYLQRYNKMRPCQDLSASHHTKLSHEMADIVAGFHRHAHLVEEEQQKEGMMKVGRIIVGKRYVVDEDLGKVNKSLQEVHARIAQIEKKISDFDFRGSDRLVDGYRKVAGVFTRPPSLSKMREEWTDREMTIAFHALMIYGNDYHRVSSFIRTKSAEQVKEFADKYREELERLEEKQNGEDEENGEEGPPVLTIEENVEESAKEMSFEENGEAVAQN
ncbi:hypothetical protein L596_012743 [Steinernema carpocapsae]|uniref:SANT domain-containing protein n=1 Tax=Steinernema carpocapsae TaxID=34508 RepID=A0A4V6A4W5_STECR|nr:hypothetical protein L596_012743 [Steinernema carpocapsae]